MPYFTPTEIVVTSAVAACVIDWPILSLSWSSEVHTVNYWMVALCGLLTLYTPFALILRNLTIEWSQRYIYAVLNCLGVPIFVGVNIFLFAKLCEQYVMYDDVPYFGKSLYISILAILAPTLLLVEFYFGLVSTVSLYSDWANNIAKCEKYTYLIIWNVLMILYFFVSGTLLKLNPDEKPECAELDSYWKISLTCLGVMMSICLVAALLWDGENIQTWAKTGLMLIYFFGYFPFYSYWISKGITLLRNGQIAVCHQSVVPIFVVFILKFSSIVPGIVVFGGLLLFLFVFIIMTVLQKSFPRWFGNNPLMERVKLKTEGFKPEKHDEDFLKHEVCSICLEPFIENQQVSYWPQCDHLYHTQCLEVWVKKKLTCPICHKDYREKKKIKYGL